MIFVRDSDTPQEAVSEILKMMDIHTESVRVLDQSNCSLTNMEDESILFFTSMPSGWLRYHRDFFLANQNVKEWYVVLLNENAVTCNQAKNGFSAEGIRLHLFSGTLKKGNWENAGEQIRSASRIKSNKVLLYSVRPGCGKRTLVNLLEESLPSWIFETAVERKNIDTLKETDAAYVILVGKSLKEFAVALPEGIRPFYVLTMPDENTQAWRRRSELVVDLEEYIPAELNWTFETLQERFFFISPLYETWRKHGTDPYLDDRFVMWDEFGLPLLQREYTPERITAFLTQFDQCDALIHALKPE